MDAVTIIQYDPHASEAYGALREGVHIAGYSFERACGKLEWLLEADRWRDVGDGFSDVNAFLASIKLDAFRPLAEQRKRIAQRIKELQPKVSNRAIAKTLGVDESTVRADTAAGFPAPPYKRLSNVNEGKASAAGNPAPAIAGADAAKLVARMIEPNIRGTQGTGESEWYTPDDFLDLGRRVLGGFDLDPASNELANATVKASRFFSQADDGLKQPWAGRVWLNPPYAQPLIAEFSDKMVAEWRAGERRCRDYADPQLHRYELVSALGPSGHGHLFHTRARAVCRTLWRVGSTNSGAGVFLFWG